MIVLTSDIDWAVDPVIAEMLEIFERYNVKSTLFATHVSSQILTCDRKLFEVAIHPNFNPLLEGKGGNIDDILDALLDIYPNSRGVRTHSLCQSSRILDKFSERNLLYDGSCLLPFSSDVKPFKLWNGMVRIPYNWSDDMHCMYGFSFDEARIDVQNKCLNVFDFHPIHVFLNTESLDRYNTAKKYYDDPKKLLEYRNAQKAGTRDLLIDLLEYIKANNIKTKTMNEIAEEFIQKGEINDY